VHHKEDETAGKITRGFKVTAVIFGSLALMCYITGLFGLGNFAVFLFAIYALHHFFLKDVITSFQTKFWPRVQNSYKNMVRWCLNGWKPAAIFVGVVVLFILSIAFTVVRQPPVVFFP